MRKQSTELRCLLFSASSGSRSVSVDRSLPPAQSPSQEPMQYFSIYNADLMTSACGPTQDMTELAWVPQVPHSQTEHPDTSAVAVSHSQSQTHSHSQLNSADFQVKPKISRLSGRIFAMPQPAEIFRLSWN